MTTTLIVLAHPEAMSFNGQWAAATASACSALGHKVIWSDLYRMDFQPAEGPAHYPEHDGPFDPLKVQEAAANNNLLSPEIQTEIAKIRQADRIIFHFPMWWFAPPAMLKGWFDRVLVHGALHDVDNRFDTGLCRDKKALFCVTTGASEIESGAGGKEADASMLLWPTAYVLRYCGFQICQPVLVHGVHGYHEGQQQEALQARLRHVLEMQRQRMAEFDALPLMAFNADTDFDERGRLKSTAPIVTDFIKLGTDDV